jgi:DNA repair exonuclease SbcCD ATPase subunit
MFKHKLLQTAEETLSAMQNIWREAGYEEIECQRLLGEFLNKLKGLCSSELDAEQQILEHAKVEVETKTAEYEDFCEQLGRTCSTSHIADLNLTERLAELERLTGSIAGEVSQRQGQLDKELVKIENLVDALGDSAPAEDAFDGPVGTPKLSDVRLNLMKRYVTELETTKAERIAEMKNLASDCQKHMADLMYAEEGFNTMADSEEFLTLDKAVDRYHRTGDFTLGLYKGDIARLTLRLKSLVEEKDRRRIELGKIGADIARLWTLLRVPSSERDQFSNSFKMNLSMETLSKGIDELARLMEVRSQSLGKVIASIREDIALLWTEAGIESEEVRQAEFPLYYHDVSEMEDGAVSFFFVCMNKVLPNSTFLFIHFLSLFVYINVVHSVRHVHL